MPSETETLGFVVLEAMASGVPVVAVAAGGIPEIVTRPGETGFLYPAGDIAAATAIVARLIANPELAASVGAAGREDVARWGWSAASRHLREVLYSRAIRHATAVKRFRRLADRVGVRRLLALSIRQLVSSQPAVHAATALACGLLVAAVAAGAPALAFDALLSCASGLSLSFMGPSLAPYSTGAAAKACLMLTIACGGALPLVPIQPLALLAGYTFGAANGAAVVWAGATLAAGAALLTARQFGGHLLRELLPLGTARPFLAAQLDRIATVAQRGGLLRNAFTVAALRLRPLAPFSLSNYLIVDAGVRPASLLLGTAAGMLPWAMLYAAAGAAWRVHVASGRGMPALAARFADRLAKQQQVALVALALLVVLALTLLRNHVATELERKHPPKWMDETLRPLL
jgi:sulfoquinovosyltransferase